MGVNNVVSPQFREHPEEFQRGVDASTFAGVYDSDARPFGLLPEWGIGPVKQQKVNFVAIPLEPREQVDHQFLRPACAQRSDDMQNLHDSILLLSFMRISFPGIYANREISEIIL